MIYVFENDNNNASVVFDENTLTEQEKAKGIALEQLPITEEVEGKEAVLKCRKSTNEVWHEYRDIKPNTELEELKQQVTDINIALAELMGV